MGGAKVRELCSEIGADVVLIASGEVAQFDEMSHRLIVALRSLGRHETFDFGPEPRFAASESIEMPDARSGSLTLAKQSRLGCLSGGGLRALG